MQSLSSITQVARSFLSTQIMHWWVEIEGMGRERTMICYRYHAPRYRRERGGGREREEPYRVLRERTVCCACTLRKVGYCRPIFPDGPGDRSNYCVPIHGSSQILTQPKNSDNELKQPTFPLKMPDGCPDLRSLPRGHSSPGGGGFSGWSRESYLAIGRCARAVQKRPLKSYWDRPQRQLNSTGSSIHPPCTVPTVLAALHPRAAPMRILPCRP